MIELGDNIYEIMEREFAWMNEVRQVLSRSQSQRMEVLAV